MVAETNNVNHWQNRLNLNSIVVNSPQHSHVVTYRHTHRLVILSFMHSKQIWRRNKLGDLLFRFFENTHRGLCGSQEMECWTIFIILFLERIATGSIQPLNI